MALSKAKNFKNFISFWFCDVTARYILDLVFCFSYTDYKFICYLLLMLVTVHNFTVNINIYQASKCQAYKCTNTTWRTAKGKSFFKITEPKNATQRKKVQQGLHNMGMVQDIKTFKFCRNSVLCGNHVHKDCIKRNLMYGLFNMQRETK